MNQTQTQQNPVLQNAMARADLINTGLHMVKQLPVATQSTLGGSMQIQLERMGITTGVMLDITVPIDVTVAATMSEFAPYSFVSQISYTDYAGIQRINTSGALLHLNGAVRQHRFPNQSAKNAGYLAFGETGVDTNILNVPTDVATANLTFSLYVPMAYDPASDLRGAVLSQTVTGDHYITLTPISTLVGTDPLAALYTAGTAALASGGQISVQAYQHYIMPQNGVANLPMIDLSTIYSIDGNFTDSSNINAGQSKYINWPNNRAIFSAQHIFNQGATGGTLNGTDISRIVLLGNSNTNMREMSPRYLRNLMRSMLGSDAPSGVYHIGSRTQPITTQLYGNVQTKFDIVTAASGSYFVSQYESTYLAGTPLPGYVQ